MNVKTVGLDLAKNIFQIHGIDVKTRQIVYQFNEQIGPFFLPLLQCLNGCNVSQVPLRNVLGKFWEHKCGQARSRNPVGGNPIPEGWPATGEQVFEGRGVTSDFKRSKELKGHNTKF